MFADREDAGRQLARRLKGRIFHAPVILGIPRGGVVPAAIMAAELNADLDVLLTRKIRAPGQPEFAIGAVSEDGGSFIFYPGFADAAYIEQEKQHQLNEIQRRRGLIEAVVPSVSLQGRSVIVTDDGIATGSTLIAGLQALRRKDPEKIMVAVPVAPPDSLKRVRQHCDEIVCLESPPDFRAVGQYYGNFHQVSDEDMLDILRRFRNRKN